MKQAKWPKMAKQWLLVATLIIPLAGRTDSSRITIDVVSKDEFVIFLLKNFENRDFQCGEIRVAAKVTDKDGRVARRSIIALDVNLPANSLEIRLEAGKEVIGALRSEMNQPRIVDVGSPIHSCKPKVFRDRLKDGSLGPEMVWIPAGRFRMGDIQGDGASYEQPVHEVSVARFAIGLYEITFSEYDFFAAATGRAKPSDQGWGRGNRPVINVSWNDVTVYAEWLSQQTGHQYRLPTEAQWEYAARAGTETARYWGNNPDEACDYANVHDNTSKQENGFSWTHHNCTDGYAQTAPVGRFKPNAFGLFDMLGNVWEWTCSEFKSRYSDQEQVCSSNEGGLLVLRGGSWNDGARYARSADRNGWTRTVRNRYSGARLARIK